MLSGFDLYNGKNTSEIILNNQYRKPKNIIAQYDDLGITPEAMNLL